MLRPARTLIRDGASKSGPRGKDMKHGSCCAKDHARPIASEAYLPLVASVPYNVRYRAGRSATAVTGRNLVPRSAPLLLGMHTSLGLTEWAGLWHP